MWGDREVDVVTYGRIGTRYLSFTHISSSTVSLVFRVIATKAMEVTSHTHATQRQISKRTFSFYYPLCHEVHTRIL